MLKDIDYQNVLSGEFIKAIEVSDDLDDDELLSLLGVEAEEDSITNLKHVKTRAEKRVVEEFANRTLCEDFEQFKPLFEKAKKEIENGFRETIRFRKDAGFTKTIIKEKTICYYSWSNSLYS